MATKTPKREKLAVDFMRALDFKIPIAWRDKSGTHRLDGKRFVTLKLSTSSTQGVYTGITAHVMSKETGRLDSQFFCFDDFLLRDLENRTDGRGDHPLGSNKCFYVSAHCGWHFYIAQPKTTRPFCEAVEGWIEEWR